MKLNDKIFLSTAMILFLAVPLMAQDVKPDTLKKDSVAAKAIKKGKTNTPAIKKAAARADTLKTKPVKLPKLVDLGANKCIPCKMMVPILKELETEYKGKLEVILLDVWENPDAGRKYRIRVIPTQIFIAPDGKELFRHEGFYSKEDMLAKWKELGYEMKK